VSKTTILPSETYTARPSGVVYEFYLSGEVHDPEHYVEWFTIMRNATDQDTVKIYINSPGGNLHTAIQFLRVLSECDAHVVTSAEGACMSAATIIFLCGDSIEVTPHSLFMFHNYSGGAIGKGGELYDQAVFERMWSLELFREVYTNFLTDAELAAMLDGKDVWLTSAEVSDRLNEIYAAKKAAYLESVEAHEPESDDESEDPKPVQATYARDDE
jgi:ATP-dependent protease ClpP protease subunit